MKSNNICTTGIPEREEKEQETEILFQTIMTENFPNLEGENPRKFRNYRGS